MNDRYYYKQKYVDRKNRENAEVETLTEEQHEVLAWLASFRHDFHMSFDSIFNDNSDIYHEIDNGNTSPINDKLEEVGLPTISWSVNMVDVPSDFWMETDWDKTEEDFKTEEEYEEARQQFRNELYSECYHKLEQLNNDIEDYLRKIDKEHGTKYAPTGIARMRKYESLISLIPLNELSMWKYEGTFDNFYNKAIEKNDEFKKTGIQPKQNFIIKDGYRIISDAITHVNHGHALSVDEWNYIIDLLSGNKIVRQEKSLSPRYSGDTVILYCLSDNENLYGICVEYFNNALPIITTAFQGTETEINEWFKRNEQLNNKKSKRARQGDGNSPSVIQSESLLGRDSNIIITYNNIKNKLFNKDLLMNLDEAGYDYSKGMSNNAVNAYNNGEMPKSKWTKSSMLDEFKKKLETELTAYLEDTYDDILKDKNRLFKYLKSLDKKKLQELLLNKSSWHHTSKFYNRTDFYNVNLESALNNLYQDDDSYNYLNESIYELNKLLEDYRDN